MYDVYFDKKGQGNLKELSHGIKETHPITFNNWHFTKEYIRAGFSIGRVKTIFNNGIYPISVSDHVNTWSGKENRFPDYHILHYVPKVVIEAAQNRKIIIIIDNQAEGMTMKFPNCDGFREMHKAMQKLKLPDYSVLLIDGNQDFSSNYIKWCLENSERPRFAHVDFFTHLFYFEDGRRPIRPLVTEAMCNTDSKDFNSLNRNIRFHRLDHLYYLITNNLYKNNLISGHYTAYDDNNNVPFSYLLNIEHGEYSKVLKEVLPLQVDGFWYEKNPDSDENSIFNYNIYKNSLLSFVTETAFWEPGMFLTEKIFKPIVAGHPFMILGQAGSLKKLKSMGYKTDFFGIDQTYDDIENPYERFMACHKSLKKWISLSREDKIKNIEMSLPMINYNQSLFQSKDYVKLSYKKLYNTVDKIFKKEYNPYEKS